MYRLPCRPSLTGQLGVYFASDKITSQRRPHLEAGCELLKHSGHRLILGRNVNSDEDAYAAGSAATRRAALTELASDPRVQYLIAGWGGKSTIDLFRGAGIDLSSLAARSQAWFGFSDACVLLNAISYATQMITFYGPNVVGKLNQSKHASLMFDRYRRGYPVFGEESLSKWYPIRNGEATGRLIGGNLSTFAVAYQSGVITAESNLIFFFECAAEDPRTQRQLLVALDIAGFWRRLNAVVLGNMGADSDAAEYITKAVKEICDWHSIPLFKCDTFGHSSLENPIIPIGMKIRIIGSGAPCAPVDYFA